MTFTGVTKVELWETEETEVPSLTQVSDALRRDV